MLFNTTFNNISVILCQSVLFVKKTTDKLYHIMLFRVHLSWTGFELTTSVVIGTDCIDNCKSNYYAITTTTTPFSTKPDLYNIDNNKCLLPIKAKKSSCFEPQPVCSDMFEYTNGVNIRSRKSQARQCNGQKKGQKDSQWSIKHYAEIKRSSNTNPTRIWWWTHVLRENWEFLFHMWHH